MALSRIATALGGLLLSRAGHRLAGRHAGKLALATLAFQLWQSRRGAAGPVSEPGTRSATPPVRDTPVRDTPARKRWSGRRV